ncbi:MAG: hypothetical protein PHR69_04800, partial [Sphaerochaeta sp.]|nr:hypothetical protein [Sphaerochaeta sp.]
KICEMFRCVASSDQRFSGTLHKSPLQRKQLVDVGHAVSNRICCRLRRPVKEITTLHLKKAEKYILG